MLSDEQEVSDSEQLSAELKDIISIYNRIIKFGKIDILSPLSAYHSEQKIAEQKNQACFSVCPHGSVTIQLFLVMWIFPRSMGVICYKRQVFSKGHKNYFKDW